MSSTISVSDSSSTTKTSRTSTGNKNMPSEKMLASPDLTFPWRLFLLLKHAEKENLQSVIAWTPDGTAFRVHKKQEFESTLLPKYFKMSKYRSFTRQLLAYGFTSAKRGGSQTGLFSHPEFLHDNPDGCYEISRRKSSTASKSSKKGNNNNETESPKPDSMATASPAMGVVLSAPDSNGADMQMMANNNVVANNNNLLQYTWANAAAAVGGSTDPKKIPPAVSMIPPFTSPMATPSASDSYLTTPSGFDQNQNCLLQLYSQLRQQQQQQQQGGMSFPISIVQPQARSHGSPSHHSSTTTSATSSTACDTSSQSSRSSYHQQQHQQSPQIAAVAASSSSATAGRGIPQMVDLTNNSGGTNQNGSCDNTNKNHNFEPLCLDNDTLNMMNNLGTIPETGRLEGVVVGGASTSLHNNNNNDDGSLSSPDDSEIESLEEIMEEGVGETIPSIQNSQERKQDVQPPSLDDELESFDVMFNAKNASTAGCFTKDCGVVAHHNGQQAMSISQRQEQDDDLLAMSDELFFEPTSIQDMKPHRRHTNKVESNNSDDLMLSSLEPRPIEDMIVEPVPAAIAANVNNPWYDWCPTMTPRQQALMEYSLPLVLPGIFYCFQLSKFGLAWCVFIVVGHTIETMLTSFGPSARDLSYRPMIVPLQHHLMDCMWLHTLISALIIGPTHFGPRGFVIGLGLIQTLPIYLSVSFKTHFEINHVLSAIKSRTSKDKEPKVKTKAKTKSQNVRKMGEHIRSCFLWYIASTICIMVGEYVLDRNFSIKMLGLFFVNFTPLYCGQCYRNQFDRSCETKEFIFQKSSLVLSTSLGEKDKAKQC